MQKPPEADQHASVLDRRYVREIRRLASGVVIFEFAIGDPDTFVEMLLPEAAFREFCETQQVVMFTTTDPSRSAPCEGGTLSASDSQDQAAHPCGAAPIH